MSKSVRGGQCSGTCNIVMVTMTSARNLRALPLVTFFICSTILSLLLFQVI